MKQAQSMTAAALLFQGMEAVAARLDLAAESAQVLRGEADREIAGVRETLRQTGEVTVHEIEIVQAKAAQRMGRPQGLYITCQIP